jgi:hypothetical protein
VTKGLQDRGILQCDEGIEGRDRVLVVQRGLIDEAETAENRRFGNEQLGPQLLTQEADLALQVFAMSLSRDS